MNATKIEYGTHKLNTIYGCKNGCSYCYAKRMNDRFHYIPKWNKPKCLENYDYSWLGRIEIGSRVLVNFMGDMFGDWVDTEKIQEVINATKLYLLLNFLFLTKNPKRYAEFEFPENCWLGTTITNDGDGWRLNILQEIKNNIKFISFEPMLGNPYHYKFSFPNFDWLILGGLTPKPQHNKWWIDEILRVLRFNKTKIFIKKNAHYPLEQREYPK